MTRQEILDDAIAAFRPVRRTREFTNEEGEWGLAAGRRVAEAFEVSEEDGRRAMDDARADAARFPPEAMVYQFVLVCASLHSQRTDVSSPDTGQALDTKKD